MADDCTITTAPLVFDGVTKWFRRGEEVDSLRDVLAKWTRLRRPGVNRKNSFLALDGVTFQVVPGEAFGIIGPNGAGKSTILKLLAGILRPSSGHIRVRGRLSALIELGAGFHGDLTGRENIFLNASVLGLSRAEVRRRFDEIIDFAEIGDFLDTPIKRYSSGMHARLGFAIAAHADPGVLLVDEVLSVGDRVFRAKCIDKMNAFLRHGVAVVFVSHDLGTVARFCHRTMVLVGGRAHYCGPSSEAISRYHAATSEELLHRGEDGSTGAELLETCLTNKHGIAISTARSGETVHFSFDVRFSRPLRRPSYGVSLIRMDDQFTMFEASSTRLCHEAPSVQSGERVRVCYDLDLNIAPGQYALGVHVRERDSLQYELERANVRHIQVDCPMPAGGVSYLRPRIHVESLTMSPCAESVLVH